jgi:hypothetical protein
MMGTLAVIFGTTIVWAMLGGIACAQTASALVLETKGGTQPQLAPYSEIPAGGRVVLPRGAKLVFLHYATCRTVAIVGGTVTFAGDTYTIQGGTTEVESRTQCPRTVRLSAEYQTGGTVLRGLPGNALTLSPQPSFVLVGKRAGDFASVRIAQGDREVLAAPLDGRQFHWPSQAPPLTAERPYELVLVPRNTGARPVTKQFRVQAAGSQSSSAGMTLLQVD